MPRGKFNEWVEEGPRRKPVTEDELMEQLDARAPNIYQGPLKRDEADVSLWTVAAFFLLFLVGVALLASALRP